MPARKFADYKYTEFASPDGSIDIQPTAKKAPPPKSTRVGASVLKRLFDIVAASALFVLVLPVFLILAVLIKLESRGPVLFGQLRRGKNGKPFRILKLRTMHVHAPVSGVAQATRNDVRITWLGKWLRRSSIDELPQLLNVIWGHMSMVGPRPHAVEHDDKHSTMVSNYASRFRTRPGLTGLAQISGLRGEIKTPDCIVRRVAADNAYIDTWSFGKDLKIIALTIPHLLFTRQAY